MSKSTHQFEVKGVDKSAGAFGSIKNRAAATSAQIRSMVGGALGALGAYFTFRSIKGGIDELGHLSDIAQKTNTNVGELTQTAAAMSALGIQNMGVDQIGKAFDYMAKSTGRSGMEGFYKTVEELGKIPDVSQRAQAAMQVFGRSGMEFMPLINAADESVNALQTVVAAMPKIPQAAANAGDAVSDAMGFAANQVKSIWLQGLASICGWFDNEYTGGVREASLKAGNYMEYYTKVAVAKCITWFKKWQAGWAALGQSVGAFFGAFKANAKWHDWLKFLNPASFAGDYVYKWITGKDTAFTQAASALKEEFGNALEEYDDTAKELDKAEKERTARFLRDFEDRAIAIKKFQASYDKAAVSIAGRKSLDGAAAEDLARQTKISNDLILGGSNAATRLQLLGPTLQSETKKQTAILERIAANTGKTADNTEETAKEEFNTLGS